MELEQNAFQNQLSNPYGCHQGQSNSTVVVSGEDILYLRQRSDVSNVALFGVTARECRSVNPESTGNIRDEATLQQLIVLSNMEAKNAEFIGQGLSQSDRLVRLHQSEIQMMQSLIDNPSINQLPEVGDDQ